MELKEPVLLNKYCFFLKNLLIMKNSIKIKKHSNCIISVRLPYCCTFYVRSSPEHGSAHRFYPDITAGGRM